MTNHARLWEQVYKFKLSGKPVSCIPYGNGHINTTYLVTDIDSKQYILQKINSHVFRNPTALMNNIIWVTDHLRKTAESARHVLTLVETLDGGFWHTDENGEYWRVYDFISDSICFERADSEKIFRESAAAFGLFQQQLADFPAHTLVETIPSFHDTPARYAALRSALKADAVGRAGQVQREIDFALEHEPYASTLTSLQSSGDLPLRVTHNDTKLNNVLFDRSTGQALCVIDLDTVMPGLSVNDFGDSIRFGASTAAEDEADLSKVQFSLPMYRTYLEGYLLQCGESLSVCEKEHLRDGAKIMTLECGVRFLTDYLSGDVYFKTHREGHNLDRCRTQFKLAADMERQWEHMVC